MRSARYRGRVVAATAVTLAVVAVALLAVRSATAWAPARVPAAACVAGRTGGDVVAPAVVAVFATLRCQAGERLGVVALGRMDPAWRTGGNAGPELAVKAQMSRAVDSLRATGSLWAFGGIGERVWWGLALRRAGDTVAVLTATAQGSAILVRSGLGASDSVLVLALDDVDGVRGPVRVAGVARGAPTGIAGVNPFPDVGPAAPAGGPRVSRAVQAATLRRLVARTPAAAGLLRGAP